MARIVELRPLSAETTTLVQAGSVKRGFRGVARAYFVVFITAVGLTGGHSVQLSVWIQRTLDDGVTWDDVLAFQSSAFTSDAKEQLFGDFNREASVADVPTVAQDGGGGVPFAQRCGILSDKIRAKWQLNTLGLPAAQSVTFSVKAAI